MGMRDFLGVVEYIQIANARNSVRHKLIGKTSEKSITEFRQRLWHICFPIRITTVESPLNISSLHGIRLLALVFWIRNAVLHLFDSLEPWSIFFSTHPIQTSGSIFLFICAWSNLATNVSWKKYGPVKKPTDETSVVVAAVWGWRPMRPLSRARSGCEGGRRFDCCLPSRGETTVILEETIRVVFLWVHPEVKYVVGTYTVIEALL